MPDAKPHDVTLMFKMLVLQALYNLSDDQTEFQVRDRLSFQRFLGLSPEDTVPDAKTLWLFREQLVRHGLIDKLFARFDEQLWQSGLMPRVARSSMPAWSTCRRTGTRVTRTSRSKEGKMPDGWDDKPNMKRQKDEDARWTKKHGKSHYGYKNHINIDKEHKLIRRYAVTDASVHDSQVFDEVLDDENSDRSIWADSAYRSQAREEQLREQGYKSRIHRKGSSRRALNKQEQATNHRRSKVRARVEHVFGDQRTPGQHPGTNQGQGPSGSEDRADEPDLQHATLGILTQAAIRLLHGLKGRKTAEGGAQRQQGEKTGPLDSEEDYQRGEMARSLH